MSDATPFERIRRIMQVVGHGNGVRADIKDGEVVGLIMTDNAFRENKWLMNEARVGFSVSLMRDSVGPIYMRTEVPPPEPDLDEMREGLAAFRSLAARIDGDDGQRQEGESVAETLARVEAVVVKAIVVPRLCGETCDCRSCVSFR